MPDIEIKDSEFYAELNDADSGKADLVAGKLKDSQVPNTDKVLEGSTKKYFTESRVLATVLTAISFATGGNIADTDSILVALGKIENRIRYLFQTLIVNGDGTKAFYNDGTFKTPAGGGAVSPLNLTANSATESPLTVKGAASQTADLLPFKNSANDKVAAVTKDGYFQGKINESIGATYSFVGDDDTGLGSFTPNSVVIVTGGAARSVIDSEGITLGGNRIRWRINPAGGGEMASISNPAAGVVQIGDDGTTGYGKIALSSETPASSSQAGFARTMWADSNYIYVQVSANVIKRVDLSEF